MIGARELVASMASAVALVMAGTELVATALGPIAALTLALSTTLGLMFLAIAFRPSYLESAPVAALLGNPPVAFVGAVVLAAATSGFMICAIHFMSTASMWGWLAVFLTAGYLATIAVRVARRSAEIVFGDRSTQ